MIAYEGSLSATFDDSDAGNLIFAVNNAVYGRRCNVRLVRFGSAATIVGGIERRAIKLSLKQALVDLIVEVAEPERCRLT